MYTRNSTTEDLTVAVSRLVVVCLRRFPASLRSVDLQPVAGVELLDLDGVRFASSSLRWIYGHW